MTISPRVQELEARVLEHKYEFILEEQMQFLLYIEFIGLIVAEDCSRNSSNSTNGMSMGMHDDIFFVTFLLFEAILISPI